MSGERELADMENKDLIILIMARSRQIQEMDDTSPFIFEEEDLRGMKKQQLLKNLAMQSTGSSNMQALTSSREMREGTDTAIVFTMSQMEAKKDVPMLKDTSAMSFRDFLGKYQRYIQIMGEQALHPSRFVEASALPGVVGRLEMTVSEFERLSIDKALEKMSEYQDGKADSPLLRMMHDYARMDPAQTFDRNNLDRAVDGMFRVESTFPAQFAALSMKDVVEFLIASYQPPSDAPRAKAFLMMLGTKPTSLRELVSRLSIWSDREEHRILSTTANGGIMEAGSAFATIAIAPKKASFKTQYCWKHGYCGHAGIGCRALEGAQFVKERAAKSPTDRACPGGSDRTRW